MIGLVRSIPASPRPENRNPKAEGRKSRGGGVSVASERHVGRGGSLGTSDFLKHNLSFRTCAAAAPCGTVDACWRLGSSVGRAED